MSLEKDYIINPKTNRPIKRGSRMYNKLIATGILGIKKENENKKVLFTIQKEDGRSIEDIKEELYKRADVDPLIHSIKKGKSNSLYKDKLIKTQKRPNRADFVDQLAHVLFKVLREDDDFMNDMRGMNMSELREEITDILTSN